MPSIPPWLRPGLIAAALLLATGAAALTALILQGGIAQAQYLGDAYLWRVLRFTFWRPHSPSSPPSSLPARWRTADSPAAPCCCASPP